MKAAKTFKLLPLKLIFERKKIEFISWLQVVVIKRKNLMIIGMYKGCCSNLLIFSRFDLRPECRRSRFQWCVNLRALHLLIHRMELFSSAKLIFVRINDITSEYFSSLFSIFWASRFMTLLAEGPAPPVDENTSGLKVLFSTSLFLCSYLSFFEFFVVFVRVSYGFGAALR